MKGLSVGVVIATRNRPDTLAETLHSLAAQSLLPNRVVVVDSSDDDASGVMVGTAKGSLGYPTLFERTHRPSAAGQRNRGVKALDSDIVVFLDDDVVLDSCFLEELVIVFQGDKCGCIGGVSGTITNQVYNHPRLLNRMVLALCTGEWSKNYAGKIVGPGVNFLPEDRANVVQEVQWLPSGCVAYRRDVFLQYRFLEALDGYSFAEDVHLSVRVAKTHKLMNTTRARVYHYDLGRKTHRDWKRLGESMVVNRHLIMVTVLGKRRVIDHLHLFTYEIVYCSLAWLAAEKTAGSWLRLVRLLQGKLAGLMKVWLGKNPYLMPARMDSNTVLDL